MKHLLREYENQKGVGECGAKDLPDREVTTRACEVDCTKCMKTAAFRKAAKNPFYGVDLATVSKKIKKHKEEEEPTLEDLEKEMFG